MTRETMEENAKNNGYLNLKGGMRKITNDQRKFKKLAILNLKRGSMKTS